jgi:gluconolactonase
MMSRGRHNEDRPAEEALVEFEVMAEGLKSPEGPVACQDGSVLLVEGGRGQITRVTADGRVFVAADTGGGPNGLAVGPDGAVYCCNNGGFDYDAPRAVGAVPPPAPGYAGGTIQRVDVETGRVETLLASHGGRTFGGPNDIAFAADGTFWFTDFGKWTEDGVRYGGLYHATIDGAEPRRVQFGNSLNGVGLSPDQKTAYASATFERWILAFDTAPEAGEQAGTVISSFPGRQFLDSLAIEADGTIAVGCLRQDPGIGRVNPATGEVQLISTPDPMPTNICFGGSDLQTAYITLTHRGALVKCRWPAPGMALPFNL